ncbi:hypothetical protein BGZ63DRAFT_390347 [Mariannaea sp. PMI_226]|nr:hypothetical protein BGZ63DRAFT_390347 [Mariannaea sp. PMI_226]
MKFAKSHPSLFRGPPLAPTSSHLSTRHSNPPATSDHPSSLSTANSPVAVPRYHRLGFNLHLIASSILDGIEGEITRLKTTMPMQHATTDSMPPRITTNVKARGTRRKKGKMKSETVDSLQQLPYQNPAFGAAETKAHRLPVRKKQLNNSHPICPICRKGYHRANLCWFFAIPRSVPGSMILPNMTPDNLRKVRLLSTTDLQTLMYFYAVCLDEPSCLASGHDSDLSHVHGRRALTEQWKGKLA